MKKCITLSIKFTAYQKFDIFCSINAMCRYVQYSFLLRKIVSLCYFRTSIKNSPTSINENSISHSLSTFSSLSYTYLFFFNISLTLPIFSPHRSYFTYFFSFSLTLPNFLSKLVLFINKTIFFWTDLSIFFLITNIMQLTR